MKTPKFLSKLSAVLTRQPRKKLQATARAVPRAAMDDYDTDEPTTKLSSAFVVVFILHVVAIGGIYAFNSIKAARIASAPASAPEEKAKPAVSAVKPPAPAPAAPALHAAARANEIPAVVAPVPMVANPRTAVGKQHLVKPGDTLTKIASLHGVKVEDLIAANNLKEGAILQPGLSLNIPAPKLAPKTAAADSRKPDLAAKQTDVPPTRTTPGLRFVRKGDTATSIAKAYGLTAEELLKFNKNADAKKLQLGQALKIPPKKG